MGLAADLSERSGRSGMIIVLTIKNEGDLIEESVLHGRKDGVDLAHELRERFDERGAESHLKHQVCGAKEKRKNVSETKIRGKEKERRRGRERKNEPRISGR